MSEIDELIVISKENSIVKAYTNTLLSMFMVIKVQGMVTVMYVYTCVSHRSSDKFTFVLHDNGNFCLLSYKIICIQWCIKGIMVIIKQQ